MIHLFFPHTYSDENIRKININVLGPKETKHLNKFCTIFPTGFVM